MGTDGFELLERAGNWEAVKYNRGLFHRLYGAETIGNYRTAVLTEYIELERGRIYKKPSVDSKTIERNVGEIRHSLDEFLRKINPAKLEKLEKYGPSMIFTTSNLRDKLYPN